MTAQPLVHLLQAPGPVLLQQARHGPIGEEPSIGLAGRAIVGLVLRVPDPLDGRAADGAGQSEPAVDGHLRPEGGDPLGKGVAHLPPEPIGPLGEHSDERAPKPRALSVGELRGQAERGEPSTVEDLIGVGVPHAAQHPRVGERPLEGVVLASKALEKLRCGYRQRFEPAAVELAEFVASAHEVE